MRDMDGGTQTAAAGYRWLRVLLEVALVLALALLAWTAVASSRRKKAAAWRTQRQGAYAEGAAVHDAIVSAITAAVETPTEKGARWRDIRHRIDNFAHHLYQLHDVAPTTTAAPW